MTASTPSPEPRPGAAPSPAAAPRRLHWGCGPHPPAGWINSDVIAGPGIDLAGDIRDGLAIESGSIDYAVAIHALQDLPWADVPGALAELRRVLRPGGVLRLSLPDMDLAIAAYQRGDRDYFFVPDAHAASVGAKLVTQLVWYGSTRTPMNWDYAREGLERAGFREVVRCTFRETRSAWPEIVTLDNRERESLFVEATA